jgi:hypothetical protein
VAWRGVAWRGVAWRGGRALLCDRLVGLCSLARLQR